MRSSLRRGRAAQPRALRQELKDTRIEGMLLINMLALLIYSLVECQVRQGGLQITTRRIIEKLETLDVIETMCWDGSLLRRVAPVDEEQAIILETLVRVLAALERPRWSHLFLYSIGNVRKIGLRMDKSLLRKEYCTLRECIPIAEAAVASAMLCRRLAEWPPLRQARTAMAYLAFRNEPDLSLLFDLLPEIRWAVPRIEERRLVARIYDPARLVRHRFGMLEPAADLPIVPVEEINVVLTPGVAFDRRGGRLGFGGGYYDRFLPTTPALRVGVCYEECLADELPCEAHDQRMDWIATPRGVYRAV